jgi:hypothetical protein
MLSFETLFVAPSLTNLYVSKLSASCSGTWCLFRPSESDPRIRPVCAVHPSYNFVSLRIKISSHLDIMLASICLYVLHFIYFLGVSLSHILDQHKPRRLTAERAKVPSHLALLLVVDKDSDAETFEKGFVECVARAVTWCQVVGIRQLTVYDSQGVYQIVAWASLFVIDDVFRCCVEVFSGHPDASCSRFTVFPWRRHWLRSGISFNAPIFWYFGIRVSIPRLWWSYGRSYHTDSRPSGVQVTQVKQTKKRSQTPKE